MGLPNRFKFLFDTSRPIRQILNAKPPSSNAACQLLNFDGTNWACILKSERIFENTDKLLVLIGKAISISMV